MDSRFNQTTSIRLGICTAMAAALLSGCAGNSKIASTGSSAESAAESGQADAAVASAERTVSRRMQSASARADLAQAYLSAGRFESAATAFSDAMDLGESSSRYALGLALAQVGAGETDAALTTLERVRGQLPASDYGLAVALAGQPARGVAVLTDAIRAGDNTPKMRQNLAYAYALDGRWTEARLMVAQDVPADQVGARLGEWARESRPEDYRARIASLIGAPLRDDPGQPAHLALNAPAGQAVPHIAQAEAFVPEVELPALAPQPGEDQFTAAFADDSNQVPVPRKVEQSAPKVAEAPISAPVVASVKAAAPASAKDPVSAKAGPAKVAAAAPKPSRAVVTPASGGSHLVQLGSFSSRANAEQARDVYATRHADLKGHEFVITEADVNGRRYWRVAAAGFDARSARSVCSNISNRGGSCFAYASQGRPSGKALASR